MIAHVKAMGEGGGGVRIELPEGIGPVFCGEKAFSDAAQWLRERGFVWCTGSKGLWHSIRRSI